MMPLRAELRRLGERVRDFPSVWTDIAVVGVLILAIQTLMFAGYYAGTASPSGDFLASYNTEAFAWWHGGGVLNPPTWMPYTWGGFPAAAQVQNSAWYLPTGLFMLLGQSGITGAAVEQALHVAFAGIGVYVLGRRGGFGRPAAAFGLVAYSFTTGFFTEAPYIDIVRGFAFAPWIVLCLSPLWPWRRAWAVPVAAILFWQAACGVYPGVLVALAYSSLAWMAVWQRAARPPIRSYLGRVALSGLIAAALSAPKFLPQLGLGTMGRGAVQDLSVLRPSTMASLFLPPYPGMPGVYSLNLLFVPAAMALLVVVASLRGAVSRSAAAMLVLALALGIPQSPLRHLESFLPGLTSSRFRLNDYLPVAFTAAVLLSMSGLERLSSSERGPKRRLADVARLGGIIAPVGLAILMLVRGKFRLGDWIPTVSILIGTAIALVVLLLVSRFGAVSRRWALLSTVVLMALAAASGVAHSKTVSALWSADTQAEQRGLWGVSSEELLANRVEYVGVQRPARTPVKDSSSDFGWTGYNASFYTGVPAVGGYFSVHQSASYVEAGRAMADSGLGAEARAFWAAPGILDGFQVGHAAVPALEELGNCASTGHCGLLVVRPIEYHSGGLTYNVVTSVAATVVANEAFYPGWSVLLSDSQGNNRTAKPVLGPAGALSFDLPPGQWRVSLEYLTPYQEPGELIFAAGLAALGLTLVSGIKSGRRGRHVSGTGVVEG